MVNPHWGVTIGGYAWLIRIGGPHYRMISYGSAWLICIGGLFAY